MHDAGLDGRLGEDRLDRLGEPGQPVDAADQDVPQAAGLQICEDRLDIVRGEPAAVEREDLLVDPTNRRWRFLTIFGSKLPSRSRGASSWTFPCSVIIVLGVVPLR